MDIIFRLIVSRIYCFRDDLYHGSIFYRANLYQGYIISGLICILDIDIQGVKSIKKTDLNPNYVFIKTPSLKVLEARLKVGAFKGL